MAIPPLEVKNLGVQFGSFAALRGVNLTFSPGEVHAVVGENGAGKSTLMNVLGGFLKPSAGALSWGDRELNGNPECHRRAGIGMIHQHFRLVPAFTVRENLELGLMVSGISMSHAERIASDLDWELRQQAKVADLGVGEQQRVEILKAIAPNPDVVIFDEPTAVLAESEVAGLLESIKALAKSGKIVILIAHKLDEVFACADQISVLRRGELVGTFDASKTTHHEIATAMVGEVPCIAKAAPNIGNVLTFESPERLLNITINQGEILGIGGVDGNGQVELAEFLVGLTSPPRAKRPADLRVAYIPQDRQRDGLAKTMSIQENLRIASIVGEGTNPSEAIQNYEIKARSAKSLLKSLSGGNQQKVVVARELGRNPNFVVAVNPTRGLDVRAAAFVHQKLIEAAEGGAAVVLISTDRDELAAVSHRQLYLSRGRLYPSEAEALAA